MTGFTERNQVVWGIAARLSAFNVVNVQNRIFQFPFAMLAFVIVPEQNIFPDIPKS